MAQSGKQKKLRRSVAGANGTGLISRGRLQMTRDQCGLLIGALLAIGIFAYVWSVKREPIDQTSQAQAAITKNVANERLLNQLSAEQARLLGEAVGPSCKGRVAFFMGLDDHKIGHWSLRCTDAREFMVNVYPDRTGSISKVECTLLHSLKTGISCFKPLRKQWSPSSATIPASE
jgi:hypothetical protein